MKFGNKLKVEIREVESGTIILIDGAPRGLELTPQMFVRDLGRRKMEGVGVDPNEEIDVLNGIKDERATGEEILIKYQKGTMRSSIILAGTIGKAILPYSVEGKAYEIGGINTHEKNNEYINIAIQKMLGTEDSIGGVVKCIVGKEGNLDKIKGEISTALYNVIPEITAIQFGNGIKEGRLNLKDYEKGENQVVVTIGPDQSEGRKKPCLAAIDDVVIESIIGVLLV